MAKDSLTAMQRLFCFEYMIDFHAENAAKRAGYSEKSAYAIGSDLMQKPHIKEFVNALMEKRTDKLEIKGETILKRLDTIGGVDIRLAYDDNNCLLPIKEMPDEISFAIASIEVFEEWDRVTDPETGKEKTVKTGETKKVRFNCKVRSNELLGKNKKLWTEKVEITDKTKVAEKMALARKRVGKGDL